MWIFFALFLFAVGAIYRIIKYWSSEYLNEQSSLEICDQNLIRNGDISIHVVTNESQCNEAVAMLSDSIVKGKAALGFDCEWVNEGKGLRTPISLLQLCSSDGFCALFRLNILGHIPRSLQQLLSSEVLKLGVNCAKDAKLIRNNYGVWVNNFLDLRYLYGKQASLARLSKEIIGFTLCKELYIVASDWNRKDLTYEQIEYAARDAWVAIEIFKVWSSENTKEVIDDCIALFRDQQFTGVEREIAEARAKKYSHYESKRLKFARKTPLYDNCLLYAPDGELLCTCNRSKAEWYIKCKLAKVTNENPFSIEFLFQPRSRYNSDADGMYYRQFKNNICVVCGSHGPFMKDYVMPREYRKYFPTRMKSHQSHDVVLTCVNCHSKSKFYMRKLKEELAVLCDAPIHITESSNFKQYKKVKNVCRTLLHSGKNIPEEKRQHLEKTVKDFLGLKNINNDVLQEISSGAMVEDKSISHGEKVVEYFKNRNGGLIELEVLWRKQFLQNLKPQFLPTGWSVDHNH